MKKNDAIRNDSINSNKKQMVVGTFIILTLLLLTIIILFSQRELDDGVIKIGYSADTLVIERWKRDQELFKAKAEAEGVEVIYYNANENNDMQVKQIESLIKEKVDVLVVIPYDKDGISAVINEAIEKGIKVIAYDRLINDAPVDLYLSFDNLKVGQLMAIDLLEVSPKGNYIIINGSPDDNNSSMFNEGYKSVLKPYIESGAIKIVKEVWADDWREAPAYDAVIEVINSGIEIHGIIGANDHLADAAIRALSENGLAGQVPVAGHDADISACQRIVEGTQQVTIYKPIKNLAESAVEYAIKLALDEEILTSDMIFNGFDVPYIKLDVIPVTRDNLMDTVIKDGFHKREDIYRD